MNIAVDVSPLSTDHKVRGVGFYVTHLKDALQKAKSEHTFHFFTSVDSLPSAIDLIHYPYFDPFFLTLPMRKISKTVVTVHDLIPLVFPKHFPAGMRGKVKWQIQRIALTRTDAIIADSFASKNDIKNIAVIPDKKISVVHLAADAVFKKSEHGGKEVRKKYNLPEKYAIYVGDATWNKNLVNLVHAMKKTNIHLVLVGKALSETVPVVNPWNEHVRQVQQVIKDDSQFHVLGFIPTEDIVALYNQAVLAVYPSRYEGFGLPIVEAMACGTPVVTTERGSLKEVAGDAAFIVDPENVQAIADGITSVFADKTLQHKLSEAGIKRAKQFSWEKTAKETIRVYEQVSSKP